MEQTPPLGKETENFVKACEDIQALMASEPLPTGDRAIIIATTNKLPADLKA